MSKIIDLSVPIDPHYWEPDKVKVKFFDHKKGAMILSKAAPAICANNFRHRLQLIVKNLTGKGVSWRDFPQGKGLSLMTYTITTHTGTHIDSPFHYGDKNEKGEPARTVSEIPLEWCYGNGVLLDVSNGSRDHAVTETELIGSLQRISYKIKPLDIVLIRTGGDRALGRKEYFHDFRGISLSATQWLTEQGVKVIGVDSFGFDPPFRRMFLDFYSARKPDSLWPAHFHGRRHEYCQIERLTNLDKIPTSTGFKVSCLPIKLANADAAWCRAVAIF